MTSRRALFVWAAATVALGGVVAVVAERWDAVALSLLALMMFVLAAVLYGQKRAYDAVSATRSAVVRNERVLVNVQKTTSQLGKLGELERALRDHVSGDELDRAFSNHVSLLNSQVMTRLDLMDSTLGEVGRDLLAASARLQEQAHTLESPGDVSPHAAGELFRRLAALNARLDHDAETALAKLEQLRHEPISEVDALLQLHRRFPMKGAVPLSYGSALSPRALLQVLDTAISNGSRTILECGSGTSTIFLAKALEDVSGVRIIALEHLPEFAQATQTHLAAQGLSHLVEVRVAPIREVQVGKGVYPWYDPEALEGIDDVDLVLVDGPPQSIGPDARYPALPLLRDMMADGCRIILDDAHRKSEKGSIRRWLKEESVVQERSSIRTQAVLRFEMQELRK